MTARSEAYKERQRAYHKAYIATPEGKAKNQARQKAYNATPEGKEKRRAHSVVYRAIPEKREKILARQKAYNATPKGKEKQRESRLRINFGITLEQYNTMLQGQGKTCAVCNCKCATGKRLAVDHCHGTGKIRGLLCTGCNTSLGALKDSPTILASALRYLAKHGKVLTTEAVFLLTVELHQSTME